VAGYSFLTAWLLDAPAARVWDAIYEPLAWPDWWPGVERVEHIGGPTVGVGAKHSQHWKSFLPYPVRFDSEVTRVEPGVLLEATADGELTGFGRWRIWEQPDGVVAATYEWNVRTTRAWMNVLAPIARPIFSWNHHYVMRRGGEGLARHLGARLIGAS
jgi:uncharacterized protein YndB with AHSA1/START domain